MAIFEKGVMYYATLMALYAILAGLLGALFGIRQNGKNKRIDADAEIQIAQMEIDDDTH